MDRASPSVLMQLTELREEGESRGFLYGMDFAIAHLRVPRSSEVIRLDVEDGVFVVYYSDMGKDRELARGASVPEVRETFLEEVARLVGPRGRGPYAGKEPPSRYDGMTPRQAFEQMQKEGFFPGQSWPGGD